MRRIRTSLSYEKRIGLPGAAGGIPVTDSIRRTLLLPVADTHLDDTLERASGKLVRCDVFGSLLVNHDLPGYTDGTVFDYPTSTNTPITPIWLQPGYDVMFLRRTFNAFITDVWIVDSANNKLTEIPIDVLAHAPGVRVKVFVTAFGMAGVETMITVHYYR